MAKKKEVDEASQHMNILAGIMKAKGIAKDVFGDDSNTALVFEIFDIMPLDEDDASTDDEDIAAFVTDLKESIEFSKEVFGVPNPTPEMTMGVFERLFVAGEDE